MDSWGKAIGYGFLVWLTPFVVAFIVFSIHVSNRPLFESIMAVAVSGTAVGFGLLYLKKVSQNIVAEGVKVGFLWLFISIFIDAPLMLFGGPMKMSISAYISDIGITYLCIPLITCGLGIAFSNSK